MKIGAWFFVCFVAPSAVYSQGEQCLTRTIPIIVRDAYSLPIKGIAPQDFVAKVGGKLVNIASTGAELRPRRVVILLDTCSMEGTSADQRRLPPG